MMEKLWILLVLISGSLGNRLKDENRTKNGAAELKETVAAMKTEQESLLRRISVQQDAFKHIVKQLRIQMTRNYKNQKKDLVATKRHIIRRNEKSVASVVKAKEVNISDISNSIRIQKQQTAFYYKEISSQIQELHQILQNCPRKNQDSQGSSSEVKILEGVNVEKDREVTDIDHNNNNVKTTATPDITAQVTTSSSTYSEHRLQIPIMELDIKRNSSGLENPCRVAALPGGRAAISIVEKGTVKVMHVDEDGTVMKLLHQFPINSEHHYLLNLNEYVYVIESSGNITRVPIENGTTKEYQIDVGTLMNSGSQGWDTHNLPEVILLVDSMRGEIISFNISSFEKAVLLTGLESPLSVSHVTTDENISYMVLDDVEGNFINLYDSSWRLVRSFGVEGLQGPTSAIMSPEGTIFISSYLKHVVTEITTRGQFVRHLITRDDEIRFPVFMSFAYPHLWVSYWPTWDEQLKVIPSSCDIKRFRLYV